MSAYGEPDVHIPPIGAGAASGKPLQRILVPVNSSGRALALAAQLSTAVDGQLRVIHVRVWDAAGRNGAGRFFGETNEQATAALDKALTSVWACGVAASGVVVDAPRSWLARVIAAEARSWGAGVMVVARRRRTAIGAMMLGSLPDQLMRQSHCPVLTTRQVRR
jgi:nucleotide-binding universal stress UspA family protein